LVKIVAVVDNEIVRNGLKSVLHREADFKVGNQGRFGRGLGELVDKSCRATWSCSTLACPSAWFSMQPA
jgi:hypothetical protein